MKTVLVDLDGTLSDNSHRAHLINKKITNPPKWDDFYLASGNDSPNNSVIEVVRGLKKLGYGIHIFSGRGKIAFDITINWLIKYKVPYDQITMREIGDYTEDYVLKRKWLEFYYPNYRNQILCVFDDRNSVVDMWRAVGIVCFQVNYGDF
jgi:hypothetical protein